MGKRVDISIEHAWDEQSRYTRIVAIGAAGGFNAKAIQDAFNSCVPAPWRTRPSNMTTTSRAFVREETVYIPGLILETIEYPR